MSSQASSSSVPHLIPAADEIEFSLEKEIAKYIPRSDDGEWDLSAAEKNREALTQISQKYTEIAGTSVLSSRSAWEKVWDFLNYGKLLGKSKNEQVDIDLFEIHVPHGDQSSVAFSLTTSSGSEGHITLSLAGIGGGSTVKREFKISIENGASKVSQVWYVKAAVNVYRYERGTVTNLVPGTLSVPVPRDLGTTAIPLDKSKFSNTVELRASSVDLRKTHEPFRSKITQEMSVEKNLNLEVSGNIHGADVKLGGGLSVSTAVTLEFAHVFTPSYNHVAVYSSPEARQNKYFAATVGPWMYES